MLSSGGISSLFILTFSTANCLVSRPLYDSIVISDSDLPAEVSNEEIPVKTYDPTWDSLESRPLPAWYDQVKVGVFFHWGVFSVPSLGNEWFWENWKTNNSMTVDYMKKNYPPNFTYQDFARDFTAEFYDPNRWVEILKRSGAKYVVLTSKHHEGYTLWPSKYSFGWNAGAVGPNRDVLGQLASAIRNNSDIRFGVYHSWFEWFNPLYLADKASGYTSRDFVEYKAFPELLELVNTYQPDVIWSDGDWEASETYWKSKEFLAWLYNSSPVKDSVVVNDRWGTGTPCTHGGFYSCQDKYNPGVWVKHKWENAMTIDSHSWGFRRNAKAEDYLRPEEIIEQLASTVSCGGNFLINVGPTKDGIIAPIMEERLLQMGNWLEVNGQAIYETSPWEVAQNDSKTTGVWYTARAAEKKIFAIILDKAWPLEDDNGKFEIVLGSVDSVKLGIEGMEMLGYKKSVSWVPCDGKICETGIKVTLPCTRSGSSQYAGTLVIMH